MSLGAIQNKSSAAEAVSYNNSTTSAIITSTNVQGAIDELFTSVSNGKSLIASAITDKGVSTSANDSWATMAGNIGNISAVPSNIHMVFCQAEINAAWSVKFTVPTSSLIRGKSFIAIAPARGTDQTFYTNFWIYTIFWDNSTNNWSNPTSGRIGAAFSPSSSQNTTIDFETAGVRPGVNSITVSGSNTIIQVHGRGGGGSYISNSYGILLFLN